MAQLDQPSPLAQLQHLHEQARQFRQMPPAKFCDAGMIRLLVTRQHPKPHIVVAGLLELARRHLAHAVPVEQQLDHHLRMVRRLAASVPCFVRFQDRGKIQLIDNVADIQRQMIVRQPLPQIRWQEQQLAHVIGTKGFSHGAQFYLFLNRCRSFFPDRLFRVQCYFVIYTPGCRCAPT
ncbi:MAG TPA: hypothetical protein VNQ74_13165, partial [Burkholderiaceae bacterium]|nr:hypothetical protein [Burkholderiaceae bacterium]